MRRKRIAVYTVVTKASDDINQPLVLDDRFTYILFSDTVDTPRIGAWELRQIPKVSDDASRLSGYPKICPELVLPDYDGWLYIDGDIQITGHRLYERAIELLEQGVDWGAISHPDRHCVYEECHAAFYRGFERERVIYTWSHFLQSESYPRHNGLFENNVIFRSNTEQTRKVDSQWWHIFRNGPIIDQIILNYVLWKHPETKVALLLPKGEHSQNSDTITRLEHSGKCAKSPQAEKDYCRILYNKCINSLPKRSKEFDEFFYRCCSMPLIAARAALFGWIFLHSSYIIFRRIIKRIIYRFPFKKSDFLGIIFRFHYKRVKVKPRNTKYEVCICCIFKNEALYLKEWIDFHLSIGIDHIYAYNNFSSDNYLEVLQPYIDDGYLTLTDWPVPSGQISAYADCLSKVKNETKWLTFIDIDEFICMKNLNNVKEWLKPFEAWPTIMMHWLLFGTSGHTHYNPDIRVTERFTSCWDSLCQQGKLFMNTSFSPVGSHLHHHHMRCTDRFYGRTWEVPTIDEHYILYYAANRTPHRLPSTIQLNHYWSKSLEEYEWKIEKGDVFSVKEADLKRSKAAANLSLDESQCVAHDYQIQRLTRAENFSRPIIHKYLGSRKDQSMSSR